MLWTNPTLYPLPFFISIQSREDYRIGTDIEVQNFFPFKSVAEYACASADIDVSFV